MNIILLSGGSGKRLWPLSNDVRSKQFIKLFKNNDEYESMVQRVYRQITTVEANAKITIATSKSQASAIKNQLGEKASICVEPCRRDTFPAIALAAAYLHDELGVIDKHPEFLGTKNQEMPVLIKFIDAMKDLSVQVHPYDDYARKYEGDNGKSEMWYVIDAEPGAELIFGFEHPVTKEILKEAVANGTLDKHLHKIKIQKGDGQYGFYYLEDVGIVGYLFTFGLVGLFLFLTFITKGMKTIISGYKDRSIFSDSVVLGVFMFLVFTMPTLFLFDYARNGFLMF